MSYSRRYVPVPKDSNAPLNKEQFLARVSGLSTDLALARYRYEHDICKGMESRKCLDEEEAALWKTAHESAKELCDLHDMSAVERLARLAKTAEAEAEENVVYSPAVDKLVEPYEAPVHEFIREQPMHEILRLAVAILEGAGLEEEVPWLLEKLNERRESKQFYDRKTKSYESGVHDPPVWTCPRCEGKGHMGGLRWAKDTCKLCGGHGCVLANADSKYDESRAYDEIELTYEGRQAINKGEKWTEEDESFAAGYETIEEAREDGWKEPDWFKPADESAEEKAA